MSEHYPCDPDCVSCNAGDHNECGVGCHDREDAPTTESPTHLRRWDADNLDPNRGAGHLRTPYQVLDGGQTVWVADMDQETMIIAQFSIARRAEAQFMVKAANVHDDLVAALEQHFAVIDEDAKINPSKVSEEVLREDLRRFSLNMEIADAAMRAALAKARGES